MSSSRGPISPAKEDDGSTLSLASATRTVFNAEIQIEFVSAQDQPPQVLPIRATVLVEGSSPIETVKIELASDSDLFFLFEAQYDEANYAELKQSQDLTLTLNEFPAALVDIFGAAASRDSEFKLQLVDGSEPVLIVAQELKFKTVIVFSLNLVKPSDETVKEKIQTRFNDVKAELATVQADLASVYAMLKIKNPNVLKQVKTRK
jgi:hypothetical protein